MSGYSHRTMSNTYLSLSQVLQVCLPILGAFLVTIFFLVFACVSLKERIRFEGKRADNAVDAARSYKQRLEYAQTVITKLSVRRICEARERKAINE